MVRVQQAFDFGERSTVANSSELSGGAALFERLSDMIADAHVPMGNISRVIAAQIVAVISEMSHDSPGLYHVRKQHLNDLLRGYRELQRTLLEADALSKQDVLNMDGPKFKFFFTETIKLFRTALQVAGIDDALAQNVMLQFGDLIKSHDERLRREVNKI